MARRASVASACDSSAAPSSLRAASSSRRRVGSSSSDASRSPSWSCASAIISAAATRCSSTRLSLLRAVAMSSRRASRVRRASSAALVSSPARSSRESQSSRCAVMRRVRAAASSRRLAVTACSSRARRSFADSSPRTRSWSSTLRVAASPAAAWKSSGPIATLGDVGASAAARTSSRARCSVSRARSSVGAWRTVSLGCRLERSLGGLSGGVSIGGSTASCWRDHRLEAPAPSGDRPLTTIALQQFRASATRCAHPACLRPAE